MAARPPPDPDHDGLTEHLREELRLGRWLRPDLDDEKLLEMIRSFSRRVSEGLNEPLLTDDEIEREREQAVHNMDASDPWRALIRKEGIPWEIAGPMEKASRSILGVLFGDPLAMAEFDDLREEAVNRLVSHCSYFPRYLRNPRLRRRLAQEKTKRGPEGLRRWLREEVFPAAMMEAFASREEARRFRLGTKWIRADGLGIIDDGSSGAVSPVRPSDLSSGRYRRWLRQETLSNAARRILEDNPKREVPAYIHPPDLRIYHRLAGRLTDRQKALLGLRDQGMTYAQIAARLCTTHANARQIGSRLDRLARKPHHTTR
ncbi:MAG: hypothetical protein LAO51_07145 [Acidobacteriia bacterium]|nr:hypothetical protein [Terriglobia bacterium]